MRINHNVPALFAHSAYSSAQAGAAKAIEKLSTGLRINSAADDAAGLGISEKMRSQIRGLAQAGRNAQDGMSMIQTAEGALQEVHSMLHRMRELSVQASNDILTAQDRSYIQGEIDQLKDAIDRTAGTTQFNKKRLLDGSSSVLWSSDNLATEAIIKHGLTSIDQFGQKETAAGNYKIQITAEPGEAEVLKSNIFEIAAEGGDYWLYSKATMEKTITETTQSTLPPGSFSTGGSCSHIVVTGLEGGLEADSRYSITFPNQITQAEARVVSAYNMQDTDIILNPNFPPGTLNANMIFEAVEIHDVEDAVTFRVLSKRFDSMGVTQPDIVSFVTISANGIIGGGAENGPVQPKPDGSYEIVSFDDLGITLPPDAIRLNKPYDQFVVENTDPDGTVTYGSKFLYSVIAPLPARTSDGHTGIPVRISKTTGSGSGSHYLTYNMSYNLSGTRTGVRFPYMELDRSTGVVSICDIVTNLSSLASQTFPHSPSDWFIVNAGASTVQTNTITIDEEISMARYIPSDYHERTLAEDKAFYNASGVCVLDGPQAITLYMNGSSRDVVLYASDTFSDLQRKFNEAVASLSGAVKYSDGSYFAALADGTEGTSESVYRDEFIFEEPVLLDDEGKPVLDANGQQIKFPYQRTGYKSLSTLLVRSVTPGAAGELKFSGDDELLKALGFATIQESRETEYTVSVYDAHSGKLIKSPQRIAGNTIYDAIDGVDVRFDPLAGISVTWNGEMKRYEFTADSEIYTTYVHLADKTAMLQTGANEGENFSLTFGDVSASSLGLDGVLVVSRETAARAVTVLDNAISKVSGMRAALGSQQNRLEHTIANITTAQTNVTAAESRIRDADMAKEMLEFTKLNILLQSGTAMMTQANQLPQAVLSLLR